MMPASVVSVTEIVTPSGAGGLSNWTRAHADAPGINWSVLPGPGGTMIVVEHAEDRCTLAGTGAGS